MEWEGKRAILSGLQPLVYAPPPAADSDVAGYVRAASSVRRWKDQLWVAQDDVNALAQVRGGKVTALLLPVGPNGKRSFEEQSGNKHHKMDLEASIVLDDGRLVVFGSGSTPARERLAVVDRTGTVVVREAGALYAALNALTAFAGAGLNLEGVVVAGETLRLLQRGNGGIVDGRRPVNATADMPLSGFVDWLEGRGAVPEPVDVRVYELGSISGVPWTFTDATTLPDGTVVFVGAAEASPDTYRDGEVVGSCVGVLRDGLAEVLPIVDERGQLAKVKLEGIEAQPGSEAAFWVVADMDDARLPALIGQLNIVDG